MSLIYLVLKIYPYLSVALIILLIDLARTAKRKGAKKLLLVEGFVLVFLFFSTLAWFYFRGDLYADNWYQTVDRETPAVLMKKTQ